MRTRKFTIKASLREHRVFRSTGGLGVFLSNFYFISQISESAFRCQWVSLGIAYWWDPHRTLNFSTKKTFAQEWSPTVPYEQDSDGRGLLRLCRLGAGSNHAQANRELNHNLPNKSTLKRFCWQFEEHENTVGAPAYVPVGHHCSQVSLVSQIDGRRVYKLYIQTVSHLSSIFLSHLLICHLYS